MEVSKNKKKWYIGLAIFLVLGIIAAITSIIIVTTGGGGSNITPSATTATFSSPSVSINNTTNTATINFTYQKNTGTGAPFQYQLVAPSYSSTPNVSFNQSNQFYGSMNFPLTTNFLIQDPNNTAYFIDTNNAYQPSSNLIAKTNGPGVCHWVNLDTAGNGLYVSDNASTVAINSSRTGRYNSFSSSAVTGSTLTYNKNNGNSALEMWTLQTNGNGQVAFRQTTTSGGLTTYSYVQGMSDVTSQYNEVVVGPTPYYFNIIPLTSTNTTLTPLTSGVNTNYNPSVSGSYYFSNLEECINQFNLEFKSIILLFLI